MNYMENKPQYDIYNVSDVIDKNGNKVTKHYMQMQRLVMKQWIHWIWMCIILLIKRKGLYGDGDKKALDRLEYDEWVVPGEVEYAERKAVKIEAQLQRYYETASEMVGSYWDFSMTIQFTEHVFGKFAVSLPEYMLSLPDIDVTNDMV